MDISNIKPKASGDVFISIVSSGYYHSQAIGYSYFIITYH